MSEQVRKNRNEVTDKQVAEARSTTHKDAVAAAERQQEEASKVTDLTDELLDEIDALLEENAEQFVLAYVQKGGQ